VSLSSLSCLSISVPQAVAKWGTAVEVERRNRIRLSVWAYAYELMDDPLVSDELFDSVAAQIDPSVSTGNKKLDAFFKAEFSPFTGMWVRKHPDQRGLFRTYLRVRHQHRNKGQP